MQELFDGSMWLRMLRQAATPSPCKSHSTHFNPHIISAHSFTSAQKRATSTTCCRYASRTTNSDHPGTYLFEACVASGHCMTMPLRMGYDWDTT